MPTYEYLCRECGERMEIFQKFSEKPLRVHPECGGELQKVFHASGIVFKGSGYYVTDSRAKKAASGSSNGSNGSDDKKADKKEKADTTSSDKSGKSESGKSDSSPAAAAD